MKIEDAKAIFLLEHCAERCDGYQKDDTCENCEINAAIEALDKQIPKKRANNSWSHYHCPVCGKSVNSKYCGNCGQAID